MNEPNINGVPLREYVEALFEQERRRSEREADEREKAASALRDQQYRAMETAEHEREKAAEVLRDSMERSVREGDDRLREHISNQIQQINAALDSAEKLEIQRVKAAAAQTESVQRELALAQGASDKAVLKAEKAAEGRFDAVNEFRGQLADQAANFLPREVAETQFSELRKKVDDLTSRVNRGEGGTRATERSEDRTQPWTLWAAGAVVTLVITIVVIAVNVLMSQSP